MTVIKREGHTDELHPQKIAGAIAKAMIDVHQSVDEQLLGTIVTNVLDEIGSHNVHVEEIQDIVENQLMIYDKDVAKAYIIYRKERQKERNAPWTLTDLQQSIFDSKYRHDDETFEEWLERVSGGNQRIKKRMRKKQFLFAGRILANRGLHKKGLKVTYSNCYVLHPPEDNLESIFNTAMRMARTYSYGGGVGIDIGKLRPRNAKVHNNARSTSGAVSFMPLYSLTTETIGQKGRRGALMISIPDNHPDLEEFIDVKTTIGAITGANISIRISDEFMIKVKEKKKHLLTFTVEDTGEVIEKEVDAHALYNKLVKNNWDWAEPGMLYWDRINSWHLMSADPDFYFAGTNPCAEEPLPPGGSCLLGSINLSEFVVAPYTEKASFDFQKFQDCVEDAVVALNEVLDEGLPLHPLEEQRITVKKLRQIGLGVMGIAEMLIKMGITYGSTKSLALCEVISHVLLVQAVTTSSNLAKELGSFEDYKWEHINESQFFVELLPPDVKELVKAQGLRNSQILCIAPTGSIGTMLGISGGIEPTFSISYERTTKSLHEEETTYKVFTDIARDYMTRFNITKEEDLPEFFITSHQLGWKERIEMQAVWQRHIDASISSTINLDEHIPVEETEDIYMYAWEMGLKGCTIYRENCKRAGILVSDKGKKKDKEDEISATVEETPERATGYYSTCPECKSHQMVVSNGCVVCQDCGFSPC